MIKIHGPARMREDAWLVDVEQAVTHSLRITLRSVTERLVTSTLRAAGDEQSLTTPTPSAPASLPINVDDLGTIVTVWRQQVTDVLAPQVAEVYRQSADIARRQVLRQLPSSVSDASVPEVAPTLAEAHLAHATNRLVGVGDTVWHEVRSQFIEGVQAGESVNQIAARITGTHGIVHDRAQVVARTEVLTAARGGAYDQIRTLQLPGTHEWLATSDGRTRPTHASADGQVRPIDQPFDVGGSLLRYPGDPMGPADETIQCRCDQVFEIDEEPLVSGSMNAPVGLTAAADVQTGAMIALLPSAADAQRLGQLATEPVDQLHLTLLYLGDAVDWSADARTRVINLARALADTFEEPILGNAFGVAQWNMMSDSGCVVLQVGGEMVDEAHDRFEESFPDDSLPDQHSPWVPHIALSYTVDPTLLEKSATLEGPLLFDRVRIAFGGENTDVTLYGSTVAGAGTAVEDRGMPYEVRKGGDCPPARPFGVFKKGDGKKIACHATQQDAQDQIAALYASEGQAASDDNTHFAASVDNSAWDGSAALANCGDTACYRAVAFETTRGTPDQRQHWALPHHKSPGSPPNAAGVRAAMAALGGARNASVPLKNEAAARAHLEAHMKTINPDYQPATTDDVESLAKAAKSPMPSGSGMEMPCADDTEELGGKPKSGGKADKRLKENQYATAAVPAAGVEKSLADINGTSWQGVLVVEGQETGDGRKFADGSLTWDNPPLALRWTPTDEGQHKGAVVVARIDNIWRDESNPAIIRGSGVFDDQGVNGAEALRLVRGQFLKGVSVDVDSIKNADVELVFPSSEDDGGDGNPLAELFATPELTIFHAGRVRAATLCDIPAFVDAQVWLTDGTMQHIAAAASVIPPTVGFSELDTTFAHNCGGDINLTACAVGIRALMRDAKLPISVLRRRAIYDHLAAHLKDHGLTPQAFDPVNFSDELTALVAGLVAPDSDAPPAAWFVDPEFAEPTPLTVTEDGRVFGHGALWNSCHTGFGNACVSPPHEGAHTYYRQGELITREGHHLAVGHITLGTGHAPTYGVDARHALEHYDNTGSVVADVISGEDEHGIWVAGALRPGLSPARIRELRGAKLSGDWRRIGGQLRLVAFLAVNVPGFPVPRIKAEVSGGRQLSLVASGMLRGTEIEEREQAAERHALDNIKTMLQRRVGLTPAQRAAELRKRVLGGN